MALKRKRSSPGLSSSPYSSDASSTCTIFGSNTTTMPSFYPQSKPIDPFYRQKATWSFPTYDDHAPYLNSRTRKRHRDNRPSEHEIFATTVNRLFQAQRQHPAAQPVISTQPQDPIVKPHTQRSTLHSFWKLPKKPSRQPMHVDTGASSMEPFRLACSDCDRPLQDPDAMELDQEMLAHETSCHNCGRFICQLCAIMGEGRTCLACAATAG